MRVPRGVPGGVCLGVVVVEQDGGAVLRLKVHMQPRSLALAASSLFLSSVKNESLSR